MNSSNTIAIQLADDLFWKFQSLEANENDTDEITMLKGCISMEDLIPILKKHGYPVPDFEGWAQQLTDDKLTESKWLRYQVANKIQAAMKERGLTQADLATKLHKQKSQINRMLSGENLTLNSIIMFQDCLGIKLLDLS